MKVFYQLLVNTALASVTNFTVWFAITFYVFLETKSVFATGTISGIYLAIVLSGVAIAHLMFVSVPEHVVAADATPEPKTVDLRGTLVVLAAIPGIFALIFFTTFNNFLGGVFMALVDAYGLSLVSVETWGFLLGALSFAFMAGGAAIAKWGLGRNPLRAMMLANIATWSVCALFTIQASIVLLVIGMFLFMAVSPYFEAAEHTILQKVVPAERQGQVFGFAQSVEQAASPFMAFLIGPVTQFIFIPYMETGAGPGPSAAGSARGRTEASPSCSRSPACSE